MNPQLVIKLLNMAFAAAGLQPLPKSIQTPDQIVVAVEILTRMAGSESPQSQPDPVAMGLHSRGRPGKPRHNLKSLEKKRAFDAAMAVVSAELARQKTEKPREESANYVLLRQSGLTQEQCLRQAMRLETGR